MTELNRLRQLLDDLEALIKQLRTVLRELEEQMKPETEPWERPWWKR